MIIDLVMRKKADQCRKTHGGKVPLLRGGNPGMKKKKGRKWKTGRDGRSIWKEMGSGRKVGRAT